MKCIQILPKLRKRGKKKKKNHSLNNNNNNNNNDGDKEMKGKKIFRLIQKTKVTLTNSDKVKY